MSRALKAAFITLLIAASTLVGITPAQAGTPSVSGAFVALTPARVLDTRYGNGVATGPVAGGDTVHLQVTGRGGVPSGGVAAVALNVTVTEAKAAGFITVYPDGTAIPKASNLNYGPGQTVPNMVIAKVDVYGRLALTNSSTGTVQLIADVAGYYLSGTPTAPGTFSALSPTRILDSRDGLGASGPVSAGGTISLQVTGRGGVPSTNVGSVVLNVTVTAPTSAGFITAFPTGGLLPTASNVNYGPRETIPNLVVVQVGTNGQVSLNNNSNGTVHLIADVAGYYLGGAPTQAGSFVSRAPLRLLDTRSGVGAPAAAVPGGGTVKLQIAGRTTLPWYSIAGVVLNVTATAGGASGYITAYPSDASRPNASNINYAPAQTVPNLVIVKVSGDGFISLTNSSTDTVHLVADLAGYFVGGAPGPVSGLSLQATGVNNQVRFQFDPTSAYVNGANSSNTIFQWAVGGQSGTITPGSVVTNATAFPNGATVGVRVWATSYGAGTPSIGPDATASVVPYGPPTSPSISCTGGNQSVTCSWSGGVDNGRTTTYVLSDSIGVIAVGASGSKTITGLGYSESHTVCIQAQQSSGLNGAQNCTSATTNPAPVAQPTVTVQKGPSAVGQPGCTHYSCAYIVVTTANFSSNVSCSLYWLNGQYAGSWTQGANQTRNTGYYFGYPGTQIRVTCNGVSGFIVW